MRTWSWTHDFESYLYWWPITGASIIRDAGKEKNKAIKGKSRWGRVTNLILTKLKGYSTKKKTAKLWVQFRLRFDCAEPSRTPECNDAPRRVKSAEHREQWWWTKFCISFIYKEVKYRILRQCTATFLFLFLSVPGRRVLVVDGVLVNHSNDSQKRWLHKETHVCSPLFKCPA